jgi:hypothetical protein
MKMDEKTFNNNQDFKNKPWDTIAKENNISIDSIRTTLKMESEEFNTRYPETGYTSLGRTPMHNDFTQEWNGERIENDEKCLLIARALRKAALKSGDNILICVANLTDKRYMYQKLATYMKENSSYFAGASLSIIIAILMYTFSQHSQSY